MIVMRFVNSVFNSNSYVVHNGKEGIIIDIGDFKPIYDYIQNYHLEIKGLFITHTHYDHIYGIKDFMRKFPNVPIFTSEFGKEAFGKPNWNFSRYHDDEIILTSDLIKTLNNGDIVKINDDILLNVIATPGHDMSCLTFRIGKNIFTGDSYIPNVKVVASFPKSNRKEADYWYNHLALLAKISIYIRDMDYVRT